jgi:transketolase
VKIECIGSDAGAPRVHPDPLSMRREARLLRRDIVEALFHIGGGHYGGALSVLDVLLVLYRRVLRVAPAQPRHPERDRLILSKGHAAIALYAVLRRLGYFDAPLAGYASVSSILEGHPDMTCIPGVDFSTGSLGQGLSMAAGAALALRGRAPAVWAVLGDGECQEGQVWEAAMLSASNRLDNLHAVVDCNGYQEWGRAPSTAEPAPVPVPGLAEKWRAFGWHVIDCAGHDHGALERAMTESLVVRGRPSVILAHTVKGHGVATIAAEPGRFHCAAVTPDEHARILGELA